MSTTVTDNPHIGSFEYFAQLHEVEERHWWSRGMRDIADAMLQRHYREGAGLDVLDAGCGTGISLTWLSRYSRPRPVVGIDVSEHALEFSRSRGHTEVSYGSVTDLAFDDGRFDLVVCNDVIQHVPDDQRALKEMGRVLRPGGCLIVRTNARHGIAKDKPAASEEYRMYTRDELREKVRRAGLHLEQITHVNMLMSIVPVVKRYFRERGEPAYEDRGLPIRLLPPHLEWLNTLLHGLLKLEAWYLSDPSRTLPFGNSIMFLARKPAAN